MKTLLSQLHKEVLILDVEKSLQRAPILDGFPCTLIDEHTLEVEIAKQQSVNALFSALSAAGVEVSSMRNKSNRLEELFVSLVKSSAASKSNS